MRSGAIRRVGLTASALVLAAEAVALVARLRDYDGASFSIGQALVVALPIPLACLVVAMRTIRRAGGPLPAAGAASILLTSAAGAGLLHLTRPDSLALVQTTVSAVGLAAAATLLGHVTDMSTGSRRQR